MNAKSRYTKPYLDSSVFISWLKGEDVDGVERGKIAGEIIDAARNGSFRITTSRITIAEVYKTQKDSNQDDSQKILEFFEEDIFDWVDVERRVCEGAHKLAVDLGLRPLDAIHAVSAQLAKCEVLLAWDGALIRAQIPNLRSGEPQRPYEQIDMGEEFIS